MWVSHFAARICNGRLCRRIHICGMRPASLIGSSAVSADRSMSVFWIGSFLPCRARQGQKSPHELRSKLLQALPRPPDIAQRRIKLPVTKPIRNHALVHFFLLDFIDKLKACGAQMLAAGLELLGGLEPPTC